MTFLFNNCRNRDHSRHGEGAFFELDLTGRQGTMARDLRAGDSCVVASYDGDHVVFRWFAFAHEKRMLDEGGELVRVLFGRRTKSMALSKAAAAKTEPYAQLFDRNGKFKIVSVVKADWPPRNGCRDWTFPEWGKARVTAS